MRVRPTIGITAAMAIVGVVAIAAQNPPSSSAPTPRARSENPIIVTGCVEKTPQTAAEAPRAASGEQGFILTYVRSGTNEPTGTSGTADAPRTSSMVKYPLEGDASKLTPHLGQRVEITGMFQPNPTGGAPTLKVDSVQVVAPSCESSRNTKPE